jgi:asparagine synthase (glutamine-hydrolysing)
MAREHVTVCLSGDGGDEIFGGYNRYLWCDAVWRRTGHWPMALRRGLGGALRLLSPQAWDGLFAALGPVLPGPLRQRNPGDKLHKLAAIAAADGIAAMYKGVVDHWPDVGRLVPGGSEPESLLSRPDKWAELPDFVQQMMYLDAMTYLPDDILTKVDRASMSVSLEARVPLIDHRVVAFAWSLPLEYRVGAGQGKRVLRRVLDRHVPRHLVERPKMGFAIPLHAWLRGPLREWAEELLAEPALAAGGYLQPAPIRELWRQHLGGRRNWQHQLWDVLMFQAWRQEYGI